jgi:hypothetical protein
MKTLQVDSWYDETDDFDYCANDKNGYPKKPLRGL